MLNKEKYAREILEIVCNGEEIAVVNGEPQICDDEVICDNCSLYGDCYAKFAEWANSEYVEPSVDWGKIPVDTPILVRDKESEVWLHRYFYKYKNGEVCAWSKGSTSWSSKGFYDGWRFAKLAADAKESAE